ncbi:MAG: glycosyltransferase family 2 protein [Planctomycetota bacterium]|nr:glycosyltransferase family 2 protein [Planctomycetota bacterium]
MQQPPPSSAGAPEISVVVPIYRNNATLEDLVERLSAVLSEESAELVMVVDGCPDGGLELLQGLVPGRPHLRVVELARNYGQHAALCAGFEAARGKVILILDADLQQAPEDLPAFVEAWRGGAEFISGWRNGREDAASRRLGSWAMNQLVRYVTRVPLRDWGCPMAAVDRRIIDQVKYAGEQRRFLKPLVARLSRSWEEIEIKGHAREGKSSYSLFSLIGLALDFVVSFTTRPFQRLTGGGLALFTAGILTGVAYVVLRLAGLISDSPPLQALVVIALLVGMQAIILGMLGEYTHRIYRMVQGQPFFEVRKVHSESGDA